MDQIIIRHRHEIRRRTLTVTDTTYVTPHMLRITLHSPELADFVSLGADDHVKLFFDTGAEKPEMRDYTPRAHDPEACTLVLDFALHDAGPATRWALEAKPGSRLEIAGPRGSAVIAPLFDWYLLIGDETALPAIARKTEELAEGVTVLTLGAVIDAAEELTFDSKATVLPHWVHRPQGQATDPTPLLTAVRNIDLPKGDGFVWIAAEAGVARALRDHFLEERNHPRTCIKAAGYWTQGKADTSDKTLD